MATLNQQNNIAQVMNKIEDSVVNLDDSYKGFVKDNKGNIYFHNGNGYISVSKDNQIYNERTKKPIPILSRSDKPTA